MSSTGSNVSTGRSPPENPALSGGALRSAGIAQSNENNSIPPQANPALSGGAARSFGISQAAENNQNAQQLAITPGAPTGRSQAIGIEGEINSVSDANANSDFQSTKNNPYTEIATGSGTAYAEYGVQVSPEQFQADLLKSRQVPFSETRVGALSQNNFLNSPPLVKSYRTSGGDVNAILRNEPRSYTEYSAAGRPAASSRPARAGTRTA